MDPNKKGVIILHKYEQSLKKLPPEEQGKILMASILYDKTGEVPEFDNPATEMLFSVMTQDFDSLRESWENKKKSNHERAKAGAEKRWGKESDVSNNKNANNANSISSIKENANNAYNDYDSVSDYDNESESPLPPEGETTPTPHENESCFVPPTIEDVKAYCLERNNGIKPERFVAVNQAKGWMIGKTRIQDWKAAVVAWETNGYDPPKQDATRVEHKTFDLEESYKRALKAGMQFEPKADP